MHLKEKHPSYKHADYLNASIADMDVTASDREVLFKWGFETIAACNGISRSTAVKAFSYFDRFFSTSAPAAKQALKDKANFQLAFITCLVVALKVHSGFIVESEFASSVVCGKMYSPKEVNTMEMLILQALGWKLNDPIPHDFINYYIEIVPSIEGIHHKFLTRFSEGLVELALTKYSFATYYPSELALASIYCALHYTDFDANEILSTIEMTCGVNCNTVRFRVLLSGMTHLLDEFLHGSESNAGGAQQPRQADEMYSVETERSPGSTTRRMP
jgi:hypothetical protein